MRIARKEFMCFTLFIIVACCTACHDHESATAPERAANALTLDEVYQRGILSLIGQEILLYEDIDWKAFMKIGIPEYNEPASLSCLPMRSVSDEEANTLPIRHAWLDFEAADRYIDDPKFRNQGEGSIKIVSNDLLIEMNAMQEVQRVSYQGTLVERGHPYYVTGSFQYNSTSWFELPPQGDDACLQHVNQIEYWQDIFEFHITSVSETPPQ